jgi:hypothetical protein
MSRGFQLGVRQNANEMRDYFSDLYQWEKDIEANGGVDKKRLRQAVGENYVERANCAYSRFWKRQKWAYC